MALSASSLDIQVTLGTMVRGRPDDTTRAAPALMGSGVPAAGVWVMTWFSGMLRLLCLDMSTTCSRAAAIWLSDKEWVSGSP